LKGQEACLSRNLCSGKGGKLGTGLRGVMMLFLLEICAKEEEYRCPTQVLLKSRCLSLSRLVPGQRIVLAQILWESTILSWFGFVLGMDMLLTCDIFFIFWRPPPNGEGSSRLAQVWRVSSPLSSSTSTPGRRLDWRKV